VPLPWEAAGGKNFGFGPSEASWLPAPEIYRSYARDTQEGIAGSTLELYKHALAARKSWNLGNGSFEWVPGLVSETTLAYKNGDILVVHNFGEDAVALPEGEVILQSWAGAYTDALPANQTVWLKN
jgi:alpha-glucosidase